MTETYEDEAGVERCDNCSWPVEDCVCYCVECDYVTECACEDGPVYPAVMEDWTR